MTYFFTTTTATTIQMSIICGNSTNTGCACMNLFHEDCIRTIENEPKLVGTAERSIQIDAFFSVTERNMAKEDNCVVSN